MKKGISGSTLKIMALVSMILDHIGAVLVYSYCVVNGIFWNMNEMPNHPMIWLYVILRLIGRMGFPLYIYLLIEGITHTRNEWKYFMRMLIFCFLSEIPFDMAFNLTKNQIMSGTYWEYGYQNVFFTLAIGVLVLILIRRVEKYAKNIWLKTLGILVLAGAGMAAAHYLQTDYSEVGIAAIVVMYLLRAKPYIGMIATCTVLLYSSLIEAAAYLVLIPIKMYNGTRGLKLKYVFYILYPAHLLVIVLIKILLIVK